MREVTPPPVCRGSTSLEVSAVSSPGDGMKQLRVGIVGGSIAGCSAAIELLRAGCRVVVFERAGDALKERGVGIGVPPSVIDTLIRRDLVDADIPRFHVRTIARLWRTGTHTQYGKLIWDQPANIVLLNWGHLYRNLRRRVPDDVYRAGHRVVALREPDPGTVILEMADGRRQEFDLVVCADGYRSLGRQTLFPDIALKYAGYVLWRGVLPEGELSDTEPLEELLAMPSFPAGHGPFYFVPGPDGSVEHGKRIVNWGLYVKIPESSLAKVLSDRQGSQREGSLSPGGIPSDTETSLQTLARSVLPAYYADITARSTSTFVQAIYDCQVPGYRKGRICLAGDAGALARPHSSSGALNAMRNAIALGEAVGTSGALDAALEEWDQEQTRAGNELVVFGRQLGRALVTAVPDWSAMDEESLRAWFDSIVTVKHEVFDTGPAASG